MKTEFRFRILAEPLPDFKNRFPAARLPVADAHRGRPVAQAASQEADAAGEGGYLVGTTLPAGRYRSLRIVLGEGKGHNWGCIVFPPVCLAAVQREAIQPVMRPEDYALITREEGWQIRFRLLELWGELTEKAADRDD